MPFARLCGVVVHHAAPDRVTGSMDWDVTRCTARGVLHGGALMTLADSLGAICAVLNLPDRATTSTIESKTNFFRPVASGTVDATARPLHVGRRVIVVQTELADRTGRAVGVVTQTQAVLT